LGDVTAPFWEKPLHELSRAEWESLCDGCGKCCLHKVEDETTGEIFPTNVACKLLDLHACRCTSYRERKAIVPDCIRLSKDLVGKLSWLPSTCAYRLRADDRPLPEWHHLRSGSLETVHEAGMSVRGWTISEGEAGDLEHHMVDREL
jgi:uncharacterized cysteine cluster protein YcgN (CxxCxxCC family)